MNGLNVGGKVMEKGTDSLLQYVLFSWEVLSVIILIFVIKTVLNEDIQPSCKG